MIVNRFMKLFEGYELAHGQYRVQNKEADGKVSGRAVTVSEPATEENFRSHLNGGDYILGIIMLKQDNSCNFGVIDVDIRGEVKLNETLENLERKSEKLLWCYVDQNQGVLICIFFVIPVYLLWIWWQN